MKPELPALTGMEAGEIPRLIEVLVATERRLELLTAGEVDTVADQDGRRLWLSRAQEELRQSEAAKQAAILNALPDRVALIDIQGTILTINEAWRRYSGRHALAQPSYGVGVNYLAWCDGATSDQLPTATATAAGIRSVLAGETKEFALEYASGPPKERRWFRMTVTSLAPGLLNGAVIMHSDISEQKNAEVALRESEGRFRGTFEQAAVGISHVSPAGAFLMVNDKFCALVGYGRDELIQMGLADLTDPDDLAESERERQALLLGRLSAYTAERRYRRKTGELIWVSVAVTLERKATGEPKYFIAVIDDITQRKKTEEALRDLSERTERRERMLMVMLSFSTDFIYILDESGSFLFANQPLLDLWGLTLEEIVGKDFSRLGNPPEAADKLMREVREVFETKHNVTGEIHYVGPGGRGADYEYIFSPALGPDGRVDFVVGSTRDVTERKKQTEALRRSEKRFKALFEQAAVGVAQTDAMTGLYLHANQRYCEITGRSEAELLQLTSAAITHSEYLPRDRELARQVREGELREFTLEKRYLRKDGTEVWVNITVSAMWAPGDRPDYFMAVAQDITARKLIEEQFYQAQKMDAIGTLAGGIAHDFNNVLAAINGYTELSRLTLKENPQVREYLGATLQASNRAIDLVRQILTFSRHERPVRRTVLLRPLVEETFKLLRATIPSTIEFSLDLASDAPAVLADPTQVHQMLMNLGTNAWHAMKDRPGRLSVGLEAVRVDEPMATQYAELKPGQYVRISVGDTGCGMTPATARRIFEPFFTTKSVGQGTGLGLAVVHGIMANHDGGVTVQSQLHLGTVFELYFPAVEGQPREAAVETDSTPVGQGEEVLLIDDEELLVNLGKQTLAALGYKVAALQDPFAALEMVRSDPSRFALVITDQTMSGMTGIVLAGKLRQIRPNLPIILMSGNGFELTPEQIAATGIHRLLVKPTPIHALAVAVNNAVSASRIN